MKKLILLLALVSNISFADGYDDCLDRAYREHQGELDAAKESLNRENQDCVRYPDEEEFYACQYKAKKTFDESVEKANIRVKLAEKACAKYPW
ncbi:MAG: hypothetical protein ACHQYQ_03380 [Bacteriovoracales bacterium]